MIRAILIICVVVFIYFGLPWVYGKCSKLALRRKTAQSKVLVLTFDDGPGTKLTMGTLGLLSEYDVKATFFLLGRNIPGREAIVQRIAAQGHQICSHGYDHLHHWKISPLRALRDINAGWEAIDSALGVHRGSYPFRPPNGKLNFVSLMYLFIHRIPIVYWTFDLGDTRSVRKPDDQRILSVAKSGGDVLLAHDFDRTSEQAGEMVLKSLRSILSHVKSNGTRVVTVSQLFKDHRQ